MAKVAAKSFGQNSTERHLSFQERKQAFIEAARQWVLLQNKHVLSNAVYKNYNKVILILLFRKYIAKHNL